MGAEFVLHNCGDCIAMVTTGMGEITLAGYRYCVIFVVFP